METPEQRRVRLQRESDDEADKQRCKLIEDQNDMLNPANLLSPLNMFSPLNMTSPLNPLSPFSPMNPMNQMDS